MITQADVLGLLEDQAAINAGLNEFWIDAGYPYDRLIAGLVAAAVGQGGWGWMSRKPGAAQRGLAVIWRCIMSRYLAAEHGNPLGAARTLSRDLSAPWQVFFDLRAYAFADLQTFAKLELLGAMALAGRIYPPLFAAIMEDCGVTWQALREYCASGEPSRRDVAEFQEMVSLDVCKLLPA